MTWIPASRYSLLIEGLRLHGAALPSLVKQPARTRLEDLYSSISAIYVESAKPRMVFPLTRGIIDIYEFCTRLKDDLS